ncbi:hypothetical protein HED51_09150 [Ochrobactrum grignonense]|nr:hypothetical protein [Brucella grignonensis]
MIDHSLNHHFCTGHFALPCGDRRRLAFAAVIVVTSRLLYIFNFVGV